MSSARNQPQSCHSQQKKAMNVQMHLRVLIHRKENISSVKITYWELHNFFLNDTGFTFKSDSSINILFKCKQIHFVRDKGTIILQQCNILQKQLV